MHEENIKTILKQRGIEPTDELLAVIQEILDKATRDMKNKIATESKREDRLRGIK